MTRQWQPAAPGPQRRLKVERLSMPSGQDKMASVGSNQGLGQRLKQPLTPLLRAHRSVEAGRLPSWRQVVKIASELA